jgi:hypothetical protein
MFRYFVLLFFPCVSFASTDVDIYESKSTTNVVIEITIDGCLTSFNVPKKEWQAFANSDSHLDQMVELAKEHSSKCKH